MEEVYHRIPRRVDSRVASLVDFDEVFRRECFGHHDLIHESVKLMVSKIVTEELNEGEGAYSSNQRSVMTK